VGGVNEGKAREWQESALIFVPMVLPAGYINQKMKHPLHKHPLHVHQINVAQALRKADIPIEEVVLRKEKSQRTR
jgi:hypothetical protein